MRTVVPFLILAACAPEPRTAPERPLVHVTGALERLDPADAASPWTGVEVVQITDDVGTCALSRRIEAVQAEACADCDVLLDEVDVHVIGEIADCATDLSDRPLIGERIVFRTGDEAEGVLFVDDGDRWARYSRAVLEPSGLMWHHAVGEGDDPTIDPDLRDLPEPPVTW